WQCQPATSHARRRPTSAATG
ncbi:MAG: hypothetical protein AVDCRST_MAG76-2803, partial [uncultured Acidimicrobiales bacterium]